MADVEEGERPERQVEENEGTTTDDTVVRAIGTQNDEGQLRAAKSQRKSAFTRCRRAVLVKLQNASSTSVSEIDSLCEKMETVMLDALQAMANLAQHFTATKPDSVARVNEEMETIEQEYSAAEALVAEFLEKCAKTQMQSMSTTESQRTVQQNASERNENRPARRNEEVDYLVDGADRQSEPSPVEVYSESNEGEEEADDDGSGRISSSIRETDNRESDFGEGRSGRPAQETTGAHSPQSNPLDVGVDLWRQLQRVTIPTFNGEKRSYGTWKAAFDACIDRSRATPEYKLLQLRQYLSGPALRAIDGLGHSAIAYEAAKERLERKFGGERRRIATFIEELERFEPVKLGKAADLERFADLLDITVVNLKDSGRLTELGNGTFYTTLQRKLPEALLTQYHRWVFENEHPESVETLRKWATKEAEFQAVASETVKGLTEECMKGYREAPMTRDRRERRTHFTQESQTCHMCQHSHGLWACDDFKKLSTSQRWEKAKSAQVCYRCLGSGHRGNACRRSRRCGIDGCTDTHHRLLHRRPEPASREPGVRFGAAAATVHQQIGGNGEVRTEGVPSTHVGVRSSPIGLRIIPITLRHGHRRVHVNALLDDGSTQSYMNADVARELGLQGKLERITVSVLNGQVETFETMPIECTIESVDATFTAPFSALTTHRVTGNLKAPNWAVDARKYTHLKEIPFPAITRTGVDVLIGLDHAEFHFSYEDVRGYSGEPIARRTPLGWTCIGILPRSCSEASGYLAHTFFQSGGIESLVRQMWRIDEALVEANEYSPQEQKLIDSSLASLDYKDGRYSVHLPWKEKPDETTDTYQMAHRRLVSLEKRLSQDETVQRMYCEVLQEHLEKGYVSPVQKEDSLEGWYLPHFAVTRMDAETTKVRVVFDAAAKGGGGHSLNDYLHAGPKLQRELVDVLLRFRRHPVALVADVAAMYLQIEVSPEDRRYLRFLWRDLDQSQEPRAYEFNRVVFGLNASPFLAQLVTQEHARRHAQQFPRAAETVLKSTYMDDSMDSAESEEQAIDLYEQLTQLWTLAGMHARKWLSNSSRLLALVPPEDRAKSVDLTSGILPATKALGVHWETAEDMFTFSFQAPTALDQISKRSFLKQLAMLFDPLGFVVPFIVVGRQLFQRMWLCGGDWDDPLPPEICTEVRRWVDQLPELAHIRIPRCLCLPNKTIIQREMHVFGDASESAYGAVAYLVIKYESGEVSSQFVGAKAKVAPLSAVSIPRLELMAAVLASRLGVSVCTTLEVPLESATFWTDSLNVIWWLRNVSRRFKPFVANRVAEVHSSTAPTQWKHVASQENPADFLSRGLPASTLQDNTLWWHGPSFLVKSHETWPSQPSAGGVPKPEQPEIRAKVAQSTVLEESTASTSFFTLHQPEPEWRLHPTKFSSLKRLVRVTAWVIRFLNNCQLSQGERERGELSSPEIAEAEALWIRWTQRESFPEYVVMAKRKTLSASSQLAGLAPFLDEEGMMRVGGRLQNADFLSFDAKHPVVLPRQSWITFLIFRQSYPFIIVGEVLDHVWSRSST